MVVEPTVAFFAMVGTEVSKAQSFPPFGQCVRASAYAVGVAGVTVSAVVGGLTARGRERRCPCLARSGASVRGGCPADAAPLSIVVGAGAGFSGAISLFRLSGNSRLTGGR